MKLLVTGIGGFVGKSVATYVSLKKDIDCIGVYNTNFPSQQHSNINYVKCDLYSYEATLALIQTSQPDAIIHLAAQSSVGVSWKMPYETIDHNQKITLNLLEAIRIVNSKIRCVIVGSAEIYASSNLPINEELNLDITSPYGLSKLNQENLARLYQKHYGLNIVCTRSFNQIGQFQNTNFVIPSFIKQIKEQVVNNSEKIQLEVGNIESIRDFMDVRDSVHAYFLLANSNSKHNVYNIGSGKAYAIKEIIEILQELIEKPIEIQINQNFFRPNDTPILVADTSRFCNEFNWQPQFTLPQTIKWVYDNLEI